MGKVVEVTRRLRIYKGRKFRISPSYGFAGIEPGVIEVISVTPYEYLSDRIKEDTEVSQIVEDDPSTIGSVWVEWGYTHPTTEEMEYTHTFPLDIFDHHISQL